MLDLFNYLFVVNNRCRVECGVFLLGFLVEGFSMSGRLVFLTLWSLIDKGVGIYGCWKIFEILIGVTGVGAWNSWGGWKIFQILIAGVGEFSKTSKIFRLVFFNQFTQSKFLLV